MKKDPSHKQSDKVLGDISPREAKTLLVEWANLPDIPKSAIDEDVKEWESGHVVDVKRKYPQHGRLVVRHPKVFSAAVSFGSIDADINLATVIELGHCRDLLRKAWTAPDKWHRDWYVDELRREWHKFYPGPVQRETWRTLETAEGAFPFPSLEYAEVPPPSSRFEAIMFYFKTVVADRAKVCQAASCPAPYFIPRLHWRKYCSIDCTREGKREAKLKWWHENKSEIAKRKERQ